MRWLVTTPLAILAASAAFAAACGTSTGASSATRCNETARVYCDAAQLIAVKSGQQFVVLVRAAPGTGYKWRLAQPLDAAVVQFIESRWTPDPSSEHLIGASGNEAWKFKALAPGTATIALEYLSPSTIAPTIGDTRSFRVTVR